MATEAKGKPEKPLHGDAAQARAAEREARRAAALRANLKRRKDQGRARQEGPHESSPPGAENEARTG